MFSRRMAMMPNRPMNPMPAAAPMGPMASPPQGMPNGGPNIPPEAMAQVAPIMQMMNGAAPFDFSQIKGMFGGSGGTMTHTGSGRGPYGSQRDAIIAKITGGNRPAPMTAGQGLGQGLNSLMAGFALRNHDRGPFPSAPGGAQPGLAQGLMNFFGKGGGGLY